MARWLDRVFFSLLGGVSLYLVSRSLTLSCVLSLAFLTFLVLLDRNRWSKYRYKLYESAAKALKQEDWLRQTCARIRQEGGMILYPTPNTETFTGLCLHMGQGITFHCFGTPIEDLAVQASSLGCTLFFHPWGEGQNPSSDQVAERLRRDAPKRDRELWRKLLHLPGNRYLLTGCLLLSLSFILRRALCWRLLGSLCLLIGAFRRSFRLVTET